MTNTLLAGFTSHWLRRESSMKTAEKNPQALRGCPQRPEPLERMARTILLDNKRGWKSTKIRPKVKCFLLTSALIELFGHVLRVSMSELAITHSSARIHRTDRRMLYCAIRCCISGGPYAVLRAAMGLMEAARCALHKTQKGGSKESALCFFRPSNTLPLRAVIPKQTAVDLAVASASMLPPKHVAS
jgi:hypothetical protein